MQKQTPRAHVVRLAILVMALLLLPVGITTTTTAASAATTAPSASPRGDMGPTGRAGIKVSQVRISRSGKLTARIAWDKSLIARPGRYDRFHIRLVAFPTNPNTAPVQVLRRSTSRVRSPVEYVQFSIPRRYAKALNGASDVVLSVSQQYSTPKSRGKAYSRNDVSTTHLRKRKGKSALRAVANHREPRTVFLTGFEPTGNTTSFETFEGRVDMGKVDATAAVLTKGQFADAAGEGLVVKAGELTGSDWSEADVSKIKAEYAKFDGSNFKGVEAGGGDFYRASMKNMTVDDADFKLADLQYVAGTGTNWALADLAGADTAGAVGISVVSPQTITFPAMPDTAFNGVPPTPAATASSGLPVTYSTTGPSACSVTSSGVITFVSVGPCVILADQAGNSSYSAAPQVSQAFLVIPLTQTLIFGAAPTVTTTTPGFVSATSNAVDATITYASMTPTDCSVDQGTGEVTGLIAGTNNCTIQATSGPVGEYGPADPAVQVFDIGT